MEPVDRNFVESDDDDELAAPNDDPASRRPEDGPALELPDAKRSRLSRRSTLQNLCKMEKIRERKDVKELIRQLERNNKYDFPAADSQRRRMNKEGAHDVIEVYSPSRVTAMAERMGLDPGWSLDLTVADEDGLAWEFSTQAKRAQALKKVCVRISRLCLSRALCVGPSPHRRASSPIRE